MTTDEICADVAADITGFVGPTYHMTGGAVTVTPIDGKPGTVAEILHTASTGATWTEHDRVWGTCATCHLERPVAAMLRVDGCWYCPEPIPGCRP